tara:strand:- start:1346 stop:1576 length:231 start_codon:yes stop_codon:yes gene_type:complete
MFERIDEIKREMKSLKRAKDVLEKAIYYLQEVEWPRGIEEPHHAEMEMENALDAIQLKIDDIEIQIEYIMQTLGGI